jgi:large conductance mechanosensitive channel
MGFISEFKTFIMRGNVVDLAVGVIIGGAFNSIVTSLIQDVITPLLLNPLLVAAHVNTLQDYVWHSAKIGMFISSVITFLLTALVLFMLIKMMNRARKKEAEKPAPAPAPAAPSPSEQLLTEIRDLLKK